MDIQSFKNLWNNFTEGLIDEKEGLNTVFKLIFSNKAFFGLKQLDDDEMSDFLLYIFENIKKSFSTFDSTKSSFMTYLQNIIRLNFKSWMRVNCRKHSIQRYIINYTKSEYIEENKEPLVFSDNAAEYNETEHKKAKREYLQDFQLLAVALKSSYFLTPSHISAISEKTGYSEEYIWKMKRNVDEYMKDNYKRNETRIEKVNKSYFYRQRALEVLSKMPLNHPRYNKVYNTFIFHDKNWKNRRANIRYRTVIPVNSYIARLLNVSESVVIRAVAKAKKISASSSKTI